MKKFKIGILFFIALLSFNSLIAQSIEEGKRFIYYERYKSAKDIFQKMLTANPNNEEAAYWLGQAEIGLENIPAAKALYQNKLTANSNSALLIAGMGHVALLEGNKQDAKSRFETAISLSQGKSIPVLNAVGFANAYPDSKNGDAAYAIDQLKKATMIKGFKDPDVYANLGDAYRKFADGGNAILAYEQALKLNPNYARATYRIGKVYQTQGRSQEEIYMKYFNDAIAKDAAYAPVYNNLVDYYYETDVPKAATYLDKALVNSDDDPKACYYRASMKYAQGLFNEAITKANECVTAGGTNVYAKLYGIKGYAYNRLNDTANAKAAFEEYFTKQTEDKIGAGDYSTYATVLLKFPGNEDKAATLIDKAVALDSLEANKVSYLKAIALAYDGQKRYKESGDWYNKVLTVKKNPSNVDLYNAGYGYFRAGDFTTAVGIFNKYVEKYPEDAFGYYMIGKSNAGIDTTGALGLALPAYQKTIDLGEAATDKAKVKNQLIGAYKYFIEYHYNVKKNQAKALEFVDKALLVDPTDAQLIQNREFISKTDPNVPVKKAAPAKPVAKPKTTKPATKKK
ncbi:MAG: tetratricopeptide repeat protein [Ferruginibacter sp.]